MAMHYKVSRVCYIYGLITVTTLVTTSSLSQTVISRFSLFPFVPHYDVSCASHETY